MHIYIYAHTYIAPYRERNKYISLGDLGNLSYHMLFRTVIIALLLPNVDIGPSQYKHRRLDKNGTRYFALSATYAQV